MSGASIIVLQLCIHSLTLHGTLSRHNRCHRCQLAREFGTTHICISLLVSTRGCFFLWLITNKHEVVFCYNLADSIGRQFAQSWPTSPRCRASARAKSPQPSTRSQRSRSSRSPFFSFSRAPETWRSNYSRGSESCLTLYENIRKSSEKGGAASGCLLVANARCRAAAPRAPGIHAQS